MFLKILQYFLGLVYFLIGFLGLVAGIYFMSYSNCTIMKDIAIWLIIMSVTGILLHLIVLIIQKKYPYFSFLKLTFDIRPLDKNLLDEDLLPPKPKIARNTIFGLLSVLYFFLVVWTIVGCVISQKSSCDLSDLQYFFYITLVTNLIWILFSFVLMILKLLMPICEY